MCCTKILKLLYIGRNVHSDIDKIWRVNVSILCMFLRYSYTVHVKKEIIRNQLISYLTFYIGYWKFGNNQLINQLFSESSQH